MIILSPMLCRRSYNNSIYAVLVSKVLSVHYWQAVVSGFFNLSPCVIVQ